MSALIILLAAALDALFGDPVRWPHLVRLMGAAISRLEDWLRLFAYNDGGLKPAGAVLTLLVVGGFGLGAALLLWLTGLLWAPLGYLIGLALAFQCLAAGQLWREARAVLQPLEDGDLAEARRRLSMIVGRDTAALDQAGVRRAVIETVAENFNDGVVAPLFYLALGGPALAVAYKAVNTLDSMVGYTTPRHRELGWAAARLDDLAGWLPARLSGLLLVAASPLLGLDAAQAWAVMRRDHAAHKSPNSAWPEAAAAGALGTRLGGTNPYGGRLVVKPWINQAGRDPLPGDAIAGLRLMALGSILAVLLAAAGAAVRWWI